MLKYDWNEIRQIYESGISRKEILTHYKMASRTFQLAIKRGDIILRNERDHNKSNSSKLKNFTWLDIQTFYNEGFSIRETAVHFSINQQSIIKASKRGDIVLRTNSDGLKLRFKKYGPNVMSDKEKAKLSKRMSENNPGGKSKWFTISGKRVQGTWERDFAILLNTQNIKWERCKPFQYNDGIKDRNYTPDFYLPARNLYVEIKGYWWGNDRQKMDLVINQHMDKDILIIEKYEDLINYN